MSDEKRGRSGRTYAEWNEAVAADLLAGRRKNFPSHAEYLREFVADADDMVTVVQIINTVTGKPVTLSEPLRVHVDNLDRVITEHQERFLDEWVAMRKRGCPGCGKPFEDLPMGHTYTEPGSEQSAFCFTVPADQP